MLSTRRKLLFIEARNQHVKENLQAAYNSRAPGRELEVFGVSSTLYDKYAQRGNEELVRGSAIPAVRRFCHTISADVQLREAKHYLQSSLFGLVSSLHIWSNSAMRDGEETAAVEETRSLLKEALDTAVS